MACSAKAVSTASTTTRLPRKSFKILYLGLNEELVHAAVAAKDDDDIEAVVFDHRHGIVDRDVNDVELAAGETVALPPRVIVKMKRSRDALAIEEALLDSDQKRQATSPWDSSRSAPPKRRYPCCFRILCSACKRFLPANL